MTTLLAHHSPVAEPQGPPVILLHGFCSDTHADFPGWADRLNQEGRSCLAINLPGHGGNEMIAKANDTGTEAVVEQIMATIDEHLPAGAADPIDVVGYSLGSRLAWELPGAGARVRRLVLGGLSPMEPFAGISADALLAAADSGTATDPVAGMLAGMISGAEADTTSLAHLAEGLGKEPFSPDTNAPTCPTLFLAGSEDPMSQGVDALHEAVRASRLQRVPGDHIGALHSEEFFTATIEFLRAQ